MTAARAKKTASRGKVLLPRMSKKEGFTRHPFDVEMGTETSGLIPGRLLKTGHAHDRHSTAYFGVAPSVFRALVKRWMRSKPVAPVEDFTFIDVGAGMGRGVLLAAEFPFRKLVGIELNPALAEVARRNFTAREAAAPKLASARIMCGDAAAVRFPKGPCLAFLFNPFGESVMRRLLKRIATVFANRPGELDLLYVNNEQERVIERQAGFTRLFLGPLRRSRADAIADHTIMANQPDGEYAASNHEDCSIWRFAGKQ